jgi:hypothetical protein
MILSWSTGAGNELDLWQPVLMPLPAAILSRRTDGISVGRGYQHVYMVNATFAATAPVTLTLNTDQGVFTQTWNGSGTLAVLTRVMEKMPPNKFKVCEYQIASTQEFYLFDFEIWVGEWGRSGQYEILSRGGRAMTMPPMYQELIDDPEIHPKVQRSLFLLFDRLQNHFEAIGKQNEQIQALQAQVKTLQGK